MVSRKLNIGNFHSDIHLFCFFLSFHTSVTLSQVQILEQYYLEYVSTTTKDSRLISKNYKRLHHTKTNSINQRHWFIHLIHIW